MASHLAIGVFGLASAISWGVGDFAGGIAARRAPVLTVAVVSKISALATMLTFALLRAEHLPRISAMAWAGAAGLAGAVGLVSLYQALAVGVMGIVAPVSAVIAASIPVLFAVASEGLPTHWQITGFALAMIGVWLVARQDGSVPASGEPAGAEGRQASGLGLAAVAGLGFGGFYILISRARTDSVFWPLAASQSITLVAILAVACAVALTRRNGAGSAPARLVLLMLLAGMLDAGGNAFFVLAEHAGRLDVAAVLASLYPASTAALARVVLHERVSPTQAVGIVAVLASIPLIVG